MQAPSSAFVFAGTEKGRQARRDIDHRETGYEEENFRQSVRLHGFLDGAFEERNSIKIQNKAGRVLVLKVWEVFLEGVVREQVAHFVEPLRSKFRFHMCH